VSAARLRILLVLDEGIDANVVRHVLPAGAVLQTSEVRDSIARTTQLLDEVNPDVVLLGCATNSDASVDVVRRIARSRNDLPIVVLYDGSPNGFMDRAFDAGADDLIVLPQPPDYVAFALEKVIARRRGPASTELAPMIAVLGPKGGTGKTLTACNLAVALAEAGARTMIVDLDLEFGDVGLALGLPPEKTLYDLAVSGGSIDGEKVAGFVADHPSGARALLAPVRPDQAGVVDAAFLRPLFEVLRTQYDYVIVDTPPSFSPHVIAAIDAASDLCVVGMLDALSLKDTRIGLETLARMGYEADGITLVLNRADTHVGISQSDVKTLLGKAPDVQLPSDRAVPRSITQGKTIVEAEPRSGAARAFRALAERYVERGRVVVDDAEPVREQNDRRGFRRAMLRKAV
jgi:pilus assembly protein CpaE